MKNSPISVVITTYNDSEYLKNAIESIVSQTVLPTQLIVIDDGSKNNDSCKITNEYINKEHRIEIIYSKKKNGGVSSARNLGLKHVTQKYVTFLDADDKMLPNNLQDKFDVIKNLNDNYFGVYGSAMTAEKGKNSFAHIDGTIATSQVGKPIDGIPGGSCSYIFNFKALKDIGGYDENLHNYEDNDLIIRLIKSNKKCKGINSRGILITIRKNSLSRGGDTRKIFINTMNFLDKAEANDYFDEKELSSKRKSAYLVFIRTITFKNPIEALNYANVAFSYGAPEGNKQKVIYYFSKLIKLRNDKV